MSNLLTYCDHTTPTVILLSDGSGAGRGLTCRLMGRYDDALADFTRAIELDPSHLARRYWADRSDSEIFIAPSYDA
jgi:tetratricopeptide (TPR) repeat protein